MDWIFTQQRSSTQTAEEEEDSLHSLWQRKVELAPTSAMASTRKRPPEPDAAEEEDGDSWIPAGGKRARRRAQRVEGGHDGRRSGPVPEWRLVSSDFDNRYAAVTWMEEELKLRLRVTVTRTGDYVIRGADWDHATTLEELAAGRAHGIRLERMEATTRGVLVGYPVQLPLEPVLQHPAVAAAERCCYAAGLGRRLPTRSVLLTLRGPVPASLDLGCWGRFSCRRYVPEPVRCYRCQAFGHRQRQCQRPEEICAVCSGDHETRGCVRQLKSGSARPAPRCPNCGAGHYAWNRRCPARLRRIPGALLRRPSSAALPRDPGPPPPAAKEAPPPPPEVERRRPRRRRRRQRRRRKGKEPEEGAAPPPPPPDGEMEVDPPRPAAVRSKEPPPAATPAAPPAPTTNAASATTAAAPRRDGDASSSSRATQTRRTFTFNEAELVELLISFERLVEQEQMALVERTSHEMALPLVRRCLRDGTPIPATILTARPLTRPPPLYDHMGGGTG